MLLLIRLRLVRVFSCISRSALLALVVCVCIKYRVSKYMIIKKLTFIAWFTNLDKELLIGC